MTAPACGAVADLGRKPPSFAPGDHVWYRPVSIGPSYRAVVASKPRPLCGTWTVVVTDLPPAYAEACGSPDTVSAVATVDRLSVRQASDTAEVML